MHLNAQANGGQACLQNVPLHRARKQAKKKSGVVKTGPNTPTNKNCPANVSGTAHVVAVATHTEFGTLVGQTRAERNLGMANRAGYTHMHEVAQHMSENGIAQRLRRQLALCSKPCSGKC